MWIGFCAKITQNCYFFAISLVSFVMRFFFYSEKKQKKTNAKRFKIAAKMCNRFDMCKWRSVANTNVHVQIQITWANNVKTQQQLQQCAVHLLYYYLSSCNSSLIFIVSPTQSAFCTIQEAIAGEHTRARTHDAFGFIKPQQQQEQHRKGRAWAKTNEINIQWQKKRQSKWERTTQNKHKFPKIILGLNVCSVGNCAFCICIY